MKVRGRNDIQKYIRDTLSETLSQYVDMNMYTV